MSVTSTPSDRIRVLDKKFLTRQRRFGQANESNDAIDWGVFSTTTIAPLDEWESPADKVFCYYNLSFG